MSEPVTPSIGQLLAGLRAGRGLDLGKAAEALRCDRAIIEALEADRYADLGAAVFARGHLRRYAEFLGAPVDELLARWSAEEGAKQALPDLTRAPQAPRVIDTRRWGRLLAAVAGALAIGLAAWWILQGAGLRDAPRAAAPVAAPVAIAAAPMPAATEVSPPPAASAAAPDAAPVAAPAVQATAAQAPAAQPAPPPVAPVTVAPAPTPTPAPAPVAAAGEVVLAFTTQADCWAEVFDAQGGRRLFQIIRAGQRVTATGRPPLRVTLGRGDVTRFELDGRVTALPADAVRDAVARFEVTASGALRALPPVPAPAAPSAPAASTSTPASPTAAESR